MIGYFIWVGLTDNLPEYLNPPECLAFPNSNKELPLGERLENLLVFECDPSATIPSREVALRATDVLFA